MRSESRRWVAFGLTFMAFALLSSTVNAGITLDQKNDKVKVSWSATCPPPAGSPPNCSGKFNMALGQIVPPLLPVSPCCPAGSVCNLGGVIICPDGSKAIFRAGTFEDTPGSGNWTQYGFVFSVGSVVAGLKGVSPEGIAALGDTVFASDSSRIRVVRASTQVTLDLSSELKTRNNGSLKTGLSEATWKVAIYPDSNVANGDVNGNGAGALFYSRASLDSSSGLVVYSGPGTGGKPGAVFSASDFVVTSGPTGSVATLSTTGRSFTVPSGTNACVRAILDPGSGIRNPGPIGGGPGVPSSTPLTIGVIGLMLVAGALWVLRGRRTGTA